jgi:hypothetical protein
MVHNKYRFKKNIEEQPIPGGRSGLDTVKEILRISLSLMRIPRLFATLFLFPLLITLVLVFFQATTTVSLMNVADSYDTPTKRMKRRQEEGHFIRQRLLGTNGLLPQIQLCIWNDVIGDSDKKGKAHKILEQPTPIEGCKLDKFDIVLQVKDPSTFDAAPYQKRLNGKFQRLHLCKECKSDIVIAPESKPVTANLFSIQGLILLTAVRRSEQAELLAQKSDDRLKGSRAKLGKEILNLPGLYAPTSVSDLHATMIGILNIASLIIIASWLAMKSHRKVLDYFAASGALLPLVAASGRAIFYGSLWVLTGARVLCFLFSSAPFCYYVFSSVTAKHTNTFTFAGNTAAFGLWLISLTAMFSLSATIASISELRFRHSPLSFIFRYIPLLFCAFGGTIWGITLIVSSAQAVTVRDTIAALPLIGMIPVLLAPIFVPSDNVLALQSILSVTALVFAVRANTRWFGAHLEEL